MGGTDSTPTPETPESTPEPSPTPEPTPPGTPVITAGPADPTAATGGTFHFKAPTASSFRCSIDVAPSFVACESPRSYPAGTFPDGKHTFRVEAVSAAGVSATASYAWTVDTTPPPAPAFGTTPDNPNTKKTAQFSMADGEKGVAYTCSLDGAAYVSCPNDVVLENLLSGLHTFCAAAVDQSGNRSAPTCYTWQEATSGGGGGGGSGPHPYTITGTVGAALYPGGPAQPFNVSFSSANAGNGGSGIDGTQVSSLVITISSITGASNLPNPCTGADFALTQFSGAYPFYVPQGSSSLSSLGFGTGTWPTLRLIDRPLNQDGCRGASIHVAYEGTP